LLCGTFLVHIKDLELELRLEKAKATPNQTFELQEELKELKKAVFLDENGINAMGDKPAGLTQAYWDTGDRRVIPWDVINRLAEEDPPCKTSSGEDNVKGVVNTANATSVKEGDVNVKVNATSSEAKSAKLAKLVKLAKSTDRWCLSLYVPLSQEAKDKQRKVGPLNLWGRSARTTTAAASTPRSVPRGRPRQGEDPQGHVRIVAHAGPVRESQGQVTGKLHREQQQQRPAGQAGQVPRQARGGVPCRGAQGEDEGNEDDVARHHVWRSGWLSV
jgi:hypothetical protein